MGEDEISRGEVEMRIVRAWRYDIAMPDRERAQLASKICWPAYTHDRGDLNAQAENAAYLAEIERDASRRRSWISKAAENDYLTAMGWVRDVAARGLKPRRMRKSKKGRSLDIRQFCRLVAWGHTWKTIGEADGTNGDGAARRWGGIVEACHAIANGHQDRLGTHEPARAA